MGKECICPIGNSLSSPALTQLSVWLASHTTTIQNFVHAKHVPASAFYPHTRVVCLPGFTCTVKDQLDALYKVGGEKALSLIKFKEDEMNRRIVSSWPARFDVSYALEMGFKADEGGIDGVVRGFKDDLEAGIV